MDKPISIQDVNGNVTVTIIEGNNNKTELGIETFSEKITKDCGLQLIYKDNFKNDSNTSTNFKDWLDGFSFNIKSVYHGREFRRNELLENIKQQLQSKGRLLILGESGTSKSIILMEILCDYLEKGYKIFHNLDLGSADEIKNLEYIKNTIVELVDNGNNVIVIVDDIHNKTIANIFTLIKKIRDDYEDKLVKIKFLLAARQPEFSWAMDRGIFDSETAEKINVLFDREKRYNLTYFSEEEVKGFLDKYKEYYDSQKRNKSVKERAHEIFGDTEGHPIMVRFSVLQNGLENHVKKMYTDYLVENKSPNIERIKSVVACSLYHISSIQLTDVELSDKLALKIPTLQIMNTMIKKNGNIWTTIHPRWDLELFRYMFSRNEADVEIIKQAFSQVFMKIFDTLSGLYRVIILNTLYNTIIVGKFVDIHLIQDMIKLDSIKTKLDQKYKTIFFTNIIGFALSTLGENEKAIECYDEALRINPEFFNAYYNKGVALSDLGKYEKEIECYDEVIRINPKYVAAYYNKGIALSDLGEKEKAIECYDEAIRINPKHVDAYYNKGIALSDLGEKEKAIECYDEAIRINPKYDNAYHNKGNALSDLGEKEKAIECYDEAIRINPEYFGVYYNKGNALSDLGEKEKAIECYDEAIRINPEYFDAYNNKGATLSKLGENEKAIECYDEAIRIDPEDASAHNNKGNALSDLGENEKAIECYDEAIRINPKHVDAYYNKGNALSDLGKYEKEIECYDEVIRIDPEFVDAYYNKGNALSDLGENEKAIECYDKILAFDNNNISGLLGKAYSLIQLNRKTEVKPLIDKVHLLDPDNEFLHELKKSL